MKPRRIINSHEYAMRTANATKSSAQMSFRHGVARKKQIEAFAAEDGTDLTPVLRDAVDLYIHLRRRFGREAVSLETIGQYDHQLVGR